MFTFHVVSLPHTRTTNDYLSCAYTQKVIKFCKMMKSLGHKVILYAAESNTAPCDELVICATSPLSPTSKYVEFPFDEKNYKWIDMNKKVIEGIKQRKQPKDFICVSAGRLHQPIADAHPDLMTVEFGIGYGGTFSPYRVFESYAWMHMVYGNSQQNIHSVDGKFYDAVIPNAVDASEFYLSEKEDFYLYMGRKTDRKGYSIAEEVCKKLGKELIEVGTGFDRVVGKSERARLLSKAKAIFTPTLYVEPFGGVAVEAMMSGTPVIATDWGAFTETVENDYTGYRCRTFQEFCDAVEKCDSLEPEEVRIYAENRYSLEVVALSYQKYFERLMDLWGDGWYANV